MVLPREVATMTEMAQVGQSKPTTIAKRWRSLTLPGGSRKGMSSFAQDDMVLPTPTSFCKRMPREGALLEAKCGVWQQQA